MTGLRLYAALGSALILALVLGWALRLDHLRQAGLHRAQKELAHHSANLENMVNSRTAQLTASNQRLIDSIAKVKASREELHVSLIDARHMQQKLQRLTHQILTAQEEERKKISRELHDEVVQTLIGINVELAARELN